MAIPVGRFGSVLRVVVVAAALVCLLGAFALSGTGLHSVDVGAAAAPAGPTCGPTWVPAWHASAQPAPVAGPGLAGRTLRMVVA
ncbi:MAG: hypothetical protein H7Y15_09940, partial [Pseudonocardia sp.]|nr:hypothetical protein [Pseudonocardia sp.]